MTKLQFIQLLIETMDLLVDNRVYKIKIPFEKRQEIYSITNKYISDEEFVYWKNNNDLLINFYSNISTKLFFNDFTNALQLLHDTIKNESVYSKKRIYGK